MEIWFYHLQNQPVERALPILLEKAVGRGWRVAVQVPEAGLKRVDDLLWTYAPESFLPHGLARDKDGERQPIVLAADSANPNQASLRVSVEGADIDLPSDAPYVRAILLFDGRSEEAVAAARLQWSRLKGQGLTLAYWQQSDEGRWERKM